MDVCRRVWAQLARVRRLDFTARPQAGSRTGWQGHGVATVSAHDESDGLRLHETGDFTPAGSDTRLAFRNIYRWVMHGERLSLSHERFGREAAVWLFDLAAAGPHTLESVDVHRCGADRYHARLTLVDDGFDLDWSIVGPAKNETLAYRYRI